MRADQWESVWRVLTGAFPASPYLQNETVKVEWCAALDHAEPRLLISAIRLLATRSDRPTLKGLSETYSEVVEVRGEKSRLARLTAGPVAEGIGPRPDYDAAYEALDPEYREEIEGKIRSRYAAAYAGRESNPTLRWAWRCLVVTGEAKGVDESGAIDDPTARERERHLEAEYAANVEATRRQLLHEQGCQRCQQFSQPPAVPTKTNPTRERVGSPCPVGARYYSAHFAQGMPRPVA